MSKRRLSSASGDRRAISTRRPSQIASNSSSRQRFGARRGGILHQRLVVADLADNQEAAVFQHGDAGQRRPRQAIPIGRARAGLQAEVLGAAQHFDDADPRDAKPMLDLRGIGANAVDIQAGAPARRGRIRNSLPNPRRLGRPPVRKPSVFCRRLTAASPRRSAALAKKRFSPATDWSAIGFQSRLRRPASRTRPPHSSSNWARVRSSGFGDSAAGRTTTTFSSLILPSTRKPPLRKAAIAGNCACVSRAQSIMRVCALTPKARECFRMSLTPSGSSPAWRLISSGRAAATP